MKKILTILTIAAASALLAVQGFAADEAKKPGRRGERGDRLGMMKENLNLTPEQVDKIKPILEADREKMKALREDKNLSQEDRRAKMRDILRESAQQIKPILTPEQQEKWKERASKRRQRGAKKKE